MDAAGALPSAQPSCEQTSLLICGAASALLTTTNHAAMFGLGLALYNVSWFITYALLVGLAFAVDSTGRLAVTASGTWLLFQTSRTLPVAAAH